VKEGLLVQSVDPSSAAAKAGIKGGTQQQQQAGARQVATGGDIIVAVDGKPMKRPEDFISYLELNKKAGDTLTLTVVRGGQQQDVSLTLGERPVAQEQQNQQPTRQQPGQGQRPRITIPGRWDSSSAAEPDGATEHRRPCGLPHVGERHGRLWVRLVGRLGDGDRPNPGQLPDTIDQCR
jgi:hypothetical protein